MLRRVATTFAVVCALGAAAMPSHADQSTVHAALDDQTGLYIVVLRDLPLATYDGSVPGYAATAPARGSRLRTDLPAAITYQTMLQDRQADVRAQLGDVAPVYSYTTVLNGFAAMLNNDQVKQLSKMPEVLTVEPSTKHQVDRAPSGPAAADTSARGGIWAGVGGPANAGRGVVIGVIDSGVWPENPSFAGVPLDANTLQRRYPGFTGSCPNGERWVESTCNAKLLAARYFVSGFGADNLSGTEFLSARDAAGHGSHTAAIAAGNTGVAVRIDDRDFGKISGIAPAAGLAIYKACWIAPDPADDGCTTADAVMAIDQAVSDGVDILNYSISGAGSADHAATEVVELAFLNASGAGVFVATSAGDQGPGYGTVRHPSPWVTTVGATGRPDLHGAVFLGDGRRVEGMMISARGVRDRPLVYAGDARAPGVSARRAALCFPQSLDAAAVEAAIVVCDRGVNARLTKSLTVAQAGGAAMVLANTAAADTEADLHAVPTVHLERFDADTVKAYIDHAAKATASLRPLPDSTSPPEVADMSGRGPVNAVDGGVLKPDLTAPGIGILSAVSPPANFGRMWDFYSGSSMAAPRIAGLAAMIAAERPTWSPAAVKSALVTTASPLPATTTPFDAGAGKANTRRMLDPGLVYDAGLGDWLGSLRNEGLSYAARGERKGVAIGPADLNLPSIYLSSLVGDDSVSRTVTNVSNRTETYVARLRGVRGVDVAVTPNTLRLDPGESQSFTVAFSARKFARYDRPVAGTLTWRGSLGHRVTSPVVVRAEYVRAPQEVTGSLQDRSLDVTARAGVTGTLRASVAGPAGATPIDVLLEPGAFTPRAPEPSSTASVEEFRVPAGTDVARFDLAASSEGDDLDLYVYRGGRLVTEATSASGDEQVTLTRPAAGNYDVYVVSVTSDSGGATAAELTGWVLPGRSDGAAEITPDPLTVTGDQNVSITVEFGRLDSEQRWFGYLDYADSSRRTYLTID